MGSRTVASSGGERRASEPVGWRRRGPDKAGLVALASLLMLAGTVVALHVDKYRQLSPIDELHHVDYMIKASKGQLLRRGDVIGPETRREGACRGVDAPGQPTPDCSDPSWLAGREFNTEEIQPPAYYFVTGLVARILRPLIGSRSIVQAARLLGAVWLCAGVVVLWALLSLLSVPVVPRWAVCALILTSPAVLHASATVTDDATALVAGGGVLLVVLGWEKRVISGFVVPVVVVLAVSLRLTNFVGAGVAVLYLLLRAAGSSDDGTTLDGRSARSLVLMGVGTAVGIAAAGVAWVALNSAVARAGPLANPNTLNQQVAGLPIELIAGQFGAVVTPVHDPYLVPFLRDNFVRAVVSLTNWLLLGSTLAAAAWAAKHTRAVAIGVSAFVGMAVTGPLFVVTNYVFQGAYYDIPARYGLSLVPALALALGVSLRKRWTQLAVVALAVVSVGITLVAEVR